MNPRLGSQPPIDLPEHRPRDCQQLPATGDRHLLLAHELLESQNGAPGLVQVAERERAVGQVVEQSGLVGVLADRFPQESGDLVLAGAAGEQQPEEDGRVQASRLDAERAACEFFRLRALPVAEREAGQEHPLLGRGVLLQLGEPPAVRRLPRPPLHLSRRAPRVLCGPPQQRSPRAARA
jgi:hypothetical protein